MGSRPTDSIGHFHISKCPNLVLKNIFFKKILFKIWIWIYERTWEGWVKTIMYELLLDDLLKELEENGIDTSKLNIIEDTEETENTV